jgi:hypothetical protein
MVYRRRSIRSQFEVVMLACSRIGAKKRVAVRTDAVGEIAGIQQEFGALGAGAILNRLSSSPIPWNWEALLRPRPWKLGGTMKSIASIKVKPIFGTEVGAVCVHIGGFLSLFSAG